MDVCHGHFSHTAVNCYFQTNRIFLQVVEVHTVSPCYTVACAIEIMMAIALVRFIKNTLRMMMTMS